MKTIKKIQALIGILLFGVAMEVAAVPITGEIGMGGAFIAVDDTWTDISNIDSATGIDFTSDSFYVVTSSGSFDSLTFGQQGSIQDFQFDPGLGINDGSGGITAVSSIENFWSVGGFNFELTSVDKLLTSSDPFLDLEGTGIMTGGIDADGNSYDATMGTWTFTGDTAGGAFTWSAGSAAVPEPAMLALMGIGLVGFAVRRQT